MLARGAYAAMVVPVQTDAGSLVCQFGNSKGEKATPFAAVSCEVLRGPSAGQKITWFGYFSDTAGASGKSVTDRTLESLRSMGFKGDDLSKFNDEMPDIEFEIVVEHETYDGKLRAKVAWVNASNRGVRIEAPMSAKDLGLFGARFKSKLRSFAPIEGKKAERQAPSAGTTEPAGGEDRGDDPMADSRSGGTPPDDDDGIPF